MSGRGGSLLEAGTTQVVVVTDQTFEASPSEVAPHTGVTRHALVARHGPQVSGGQSDSTVSWTADLGWAVSNYHSLNYQDTL